MVPILRLRLRKLEPKAVLLTLVDYALGGRSPNQDGLKGLSRRQRTHKVMMTHSIYRRCPEFFDPAMPPLTTTGLYAVRTRADNEALSSIAVSWQKG